MGIDIARHGARENLAGGRHRTNGQRPFEPGAQEPYLVVEPDAALAFELPDLLFDLLADVVALLLEQPDLAADVAFDKRLAELEKPELALDCLFEFVQGGK